MDNGISHGFYNQSLLQSNVSISISNMTWTNVDNDAIFTLEIVTTLICIWILCAIFSHLCEFRTVCCCIHFSDRYTWIIQPSTANKMYALLTPLCVATSFLCMTVLDSLWIFTEYLSYDLYNLYQLPTEILYALGHIFYFLYLVSLIEYHMKSEMLIKTMIPKYSIIIIKVAILSELVYCAIENWIWYESMENFEYKGIPYSLYCDIFGLIIKVVLEITLLRLYYSGLNNVCHFWYSKHWEEYDKYGETEKIHEILITITRVTVVMFVSVISTIIYMTYCMWYQYYLWSYASLGELVIGDCINTLLAAINEITYCLAVYFGYPFNHQKYEKIFSRCHKIIYSCFKKKHQKQVTCGGLDGNRYRRYSDIMVQPN